MAPRMSQNDDGSPSPLPEELDRALRRATSRSLSALTSLRKAVLQQVNSGQEHGTTLAQLKLDLLEIISRVQDSDGRGDGDGSRDGADNEHETVAAQVIKWTDGFYKRSD
jgi:hypothetical protein